MSGKYQQKKTAKNKKKVPGKMRYLPGILAAILMTLTAVLVVALRQESPEQSQQTQATGVFTKGTETETAVFPASGSMEYETAELAEQVHDLGRGIRITKLGKYTGIYMEDGSDDVVTDVLMVMVTNTGMEYIQYAKFQLTDGETVASFSLSTLMPGETMVVLESGRMTYDSGTVFTNATLENIAVFSDAPGLCGDQIRIQSLDGVLNVTNISGADITGDIVIYYKNSAQGIYYGGITYRGRIEGGLRAGEVRQVVAEHYSVNGSTIVFVTCG